MKMEGIKYPGESVAKAAWQIMMEKGWSVKEGAWDTWIALDSEGYRLPNQPEAGFCDPFTALCETKAKNPNL